MIIAGSLFSEMILSGTGGGAMGGAISEGTDFGSPLMEAYTPELKYVTMATLVISYKTNQ